MLQPFSMHRETAMAAVVAFVSQKGGPGKSTLARALAREGAASGLKVKLADLDLQQGTSLDWSRTRLQFGIEPSISVEAFSTAAKALAVADQYDLLVIDGPARASAGTLEIAKASDLIIQPSGASLDDLRPAVKLFHELVKAGIPLERLAIALNHVATDAEEADARAYVGQAGYAVLAGCLVERPLYRQAQNGGFAVTEAKHARLRERADVLIQSIVNRIAA